MKVKRLEWRFSTDEKKDQNMEVNRKRGPKPLVFCQDDIEKVGRMASIGCTDIMIANIMGVPYGTFRDLKRRDEQISTLIKRGRDSMMAKVMETAFQMAIDGKNPSMVMFLLKTKCGWRETGDIPDPDEEPIDFEALRAIT
jgi:hypothetical protein